MRKKFPQAIGICFFMLLPPLAAQESALKDPDRTAAPAGQEILEPVHAKIVTTDASPVDPGHVELNLVYSLQGGSFAWRTSGERYHRREFVNHVWDIQANVGVYKNIDVGILQGFACLRDMENNYNEFAGVIDPNTGTEMEDPTEGPYHGGGHGDLIVTGRWRFFQSEKHKLEIAYNPTVVIPTGRRSDLDRLGPSQGYVSFTNMLLFTKDIGRFSGTFAAGYTAPLASKERTGNSAGSYDINFALGYQLFSWLHPEIECLWSQGFQSPGKGAKIFSMVAGVIIPVNDHLRFDAGIQQDLAGSGVNQTTAGIFKVILTT